MGIRDGYDKVAITNEEREGGEYEGESSGFFFSSRRRHTSSSLVSWARNVYKRQPSVHIAFNEATAILAADALQSLAFHILAVDDVYRNLNNVPATLISLLAQAAGTNGMSGGQALDLAAEGQALDQSELEHIYRLKTGKLLRACVLSAVCVAPSVSLEKRQLLERFIDAIGLAFQIKDDILDVEGHTKTIGKPAGSDGKKVKATYPSLFGLEASKQRINELLTTGLGLLEPFGKAADGLRHLAMIIVQREM